MPGSRSFNGTSGIVNAGGAMTKPTAGTGLTVGAWIYPTGFGEGSLGRIIEFNSGSVFFVDSTSSGTLRGLVDYVTTDSDRRSAASFVTLNAWQFVAMLWTGGTAITDITLWKGTFGGVPTESSSYSTVSSSSGALTGFTGDLTIGNRTGDDRTFAGRIAHAFYINRPLTAGELAIAMYAPHRIPGVLTYLPLWGLASPEPDLSGGGHNGTVTTATAGDGGPPIGAYRRYTYGRYKEAAPAFQVQSYPYDTAVGSLMTLPYDTLLGTAMSFPYDALTGVRVVTEFPFDANAGAIQARIGFPYDTFEHPHVITSFPYDVVVTPVFTSPMRRSSQVVP